MNVIKRFTSSVSHSIGSVVARMENHEAVADAALSNMRRSAGAARARLARVGRDRELLQQRQQQFESQARKWAARAASVAQQDESKALECVRRRNECLTRAESAARALAELEQQHDRLAVSVDEMEARLQALASERNVLRTRESVADAQRSLSRFDAGECEQIDEVFARWEAAVVADEYCSGGPATVDAMEAQFEREEQAHDLKAQLDELLHQTRNHGGHAEGERS